ncbi:MAG TPA: hypothetical protein VG347_14975 [Verrucomicrobiae bacterium]|nr:hypothetical protein [Verrucomicrobiae bacterium]
MNSKSEPSAVIPPVENLRLLKWNELVRRGDYVEDGKLGFEPWLGPTGFHADSFIKAIYRKYSPRKKTEPPPVTRRPTIL